MPILVLINEKTIEMIITFWLIMRAVLVVSLRYSCVDAAWRCGQSRENESLGRTRAWCSRTSSRSLRRGRPPLPPVWPRSARAPALRTHPTRRLTARSPAAPFVGARAAGASALSRRPPPPPPSAHSVRVGDRSPTAAPPQLFTYFNRCVSCISMFRRLLDRCLVI